jgi:threonine aldolase
MVHMDGARFSNAVTSLGCSPAALSHKAGIDILSLGATKNGALACEAVIVFDKEKAQTISFLQKRGGLVLSKGRFLGAQMATYLAEGHWLDLARHANAMATRLSDGLVSFGSARLPWPCDVNEVFAILPQPVCAGLRAAGASFYNWEAEQLPEPDRPGSNEVFVRFVCSFATTEAEVEEVLRVVGEVATGHNITI